MINNALKLLQVSNSIYNVFIYGKMHHRFWNNVKTFLFSPQARRKGAENLVEIVPATRLLSEPTLRELNICGTKDCEI